MALDIKERGTVGCAYYVAREERLFCMEDLPKGGLGMIEKREQPSPPESLLNREVKIDIEPTVVILSARLDASTDSNDARRAESGVLTDTGKLHA